MASPAYERRNAAARAKGYRSYYDYRAHDNGRIPPTQPRLRGEGLRRARGHAGASDLRRAVKPGTLIVATPDASSRRKDGTYGRVMVTAIGEDGSEREFVLQGAALKPDALDKLMADLSAAGAIASPTYVLGPYGATDDDGPVDVGAEDELSYDIEDVGDQSYDDIPF